MGVTEEVRIVIKYDNDAQLDSLLMRLSEEERSSIIISSLGYIAICGAVNIFRKAILLPEVINHFKSDLKHNSIAKTIFVEQALQFSTFNLIAVILDIDIFYDVIKANPYNSVNLALKNTKCAPQILARLNEYFDICKIIADNDFIAYEQLLDMRHNDLALNYLLEFPDLFDLEFLDEKFNLLKKDYINICFIEYYFSKSLPEKAGSNNIGIFISIHKWLNNTYKDRDKIRREVKSHERYMKSHSGSNSLGSRFLRKMHYLREDLSPKYDIHLDRINALDRLIAEYSDEGLSPSPKLRAWIY